ncbi:zinc finger BED domain-containing protein 1-like [Tachysurus ichikawai]
MIARVLGQRKAITQPVLHILNSRVLAEEKDDVELTQTIKTSILSEANPLDWWRKHHVHLPTLSKVAKKKSLCIPATSSPSERVFSSGGKTLLHEKVNMLVFLSKNLE